MACKMTTVPLSPKCYQIKFLFNFLFVIFLQAALVYEATAVCTYSAGQKTPFTKHVRIEGIGKWLAHFVHILSQGWLFCCSVNF